jgi:hypothetical protein
MAMNLDPLTVAQAIEMMRLTDWRYLHAEDLGDRDLIDRSIEACGEAFRQLLASRPATVQELLDKARELFASDDEPAILATLSDIQRLAEAA